MSYFFYDTTRVAGAQKSSINPWNWDGAKQYLKHYDQQLFLIFVRDNPRSSQIDKRQAEKELEKCERSLEFWRRHPRYDHDKAVRGVLELKKNWSGQRAV